MCLALELYSDVKEKQIIIYFTLVSHESSPANINCTSSPVVAGIPYQCNYSRKLSYYMSSVWVEHLQEVL